MTEPITLNYSFAHMHGVINVSHSDCSIHASAIRFAGRQYCIFLLLTACTYILTGRKHVLKSKVRLTTCRNTYVQVHMRINKGAWPSA